MYGLTGTMRKEIIADLIATLGISGFLFLFGWMIKSFSLEATKVLMIATKISIGTLFFWSLRILFHFRYGLARNNKFLLRSGMLISLLVILIMFLTALYLSVAEYGLIGLFIGVPSGFLGIYFVMIFGFPLIRGRKFDDEDDN